MFYPISEWYTSLGEYSFPTAFLTLSETEKAALLNGESNKNLDQKIRLALRSFPGGIYVGTDLCAPTDSKDYVYGRGVWSVAAARKLLSGSSQVAESLRNHTSVLIFRPARRMSPTREFRLFIKQRQLVAMSQYHLTNHFPAIAKQKHVLWTQATEFIQSISERLPAEDVVADVYYTSSKRFILIDFNPWGAPTDPKMLRKWDIDWEQIPGIKLIPKPTHMKGEISVSF